MFSYVNCPTEISPSRFSQKNFLGMHRISGPFVIHFRLTGILLDTGYGGRISHRIWRPVILPDIRPIIQLGLLQQKPTTSCCRKTLIHRTVCRVFYGSKKKFGEKDILPRWISVIRPQLIFGFCFCRISGKNS